MQAEALLQPAYGYHTTPAKTYEKKNLLGRNLTKVDKHCRRGSIAKSEVVSCEIQQQLAAEFALCV